ESVETVLPTEGGPAFMQLVDAFGDVLAVRGIDLARVPHIDAMMQQSQPALEQVQLRQIEVLIGAHGGKIGTYMAWDTMSGIRNFGPYLLQAGKFMREQWESLVQQADEELNDPVTHTRLPIYLVAGRRSA
ncbi:MAG TPA: hypothetical protein VKB76_13090, partial [Ktedonobacterales bacterium]|nr:hypothetical protein [Ktedonobacterales bacterium]